MNKSEVIHRLHLHRSRLEALGVVHAYLFGSVARGTAGPDSDVDLMVDLDEGPHGRKPLFSAFDVGGIQYELTSIIGRNVDLVVRSDALRPGKRLRAAAERANSSMSSDARGKIAILDERVILTIRDDLPALDAALAAMLDAI